MFKNKYAGGIRPMKTYKVIITEKLQMDVEVEAENAA